MFTSGSLLVCNNSAGLMLQIDIILRETEEQIYLNQIRYKTLRFFKLNKHCTGGICLAQESTSVVDIWNPRKKTLVLSYNL